MSPVLKLEQLQPIVAEAMARWQEAGATAEQVGPLEQYTLQVVSLPPGAELMAASDFTPFAALAWRDQPAISMQPHPEFEPAYAGALIEARRGKTYADDEADRALASFAGPDDRARVGGWINAFLRG